MKRSGTILGGLLVLGVAGAVYLNRGEISVMLMRRVAA
jgi:hypothetical protein